MPETDSWDRSPSRDPGEAGVCGVQMELDAHCITSESPPGLLVGAADRHRGYRAPSITDGSRSGEPVGEPGGSRPPPLKRGTSTAPRWGSGAEDDLGGAGVDLVDRRLHRLAVLLEREFMGDDDLVWEQSCSQDVDRPIDRVAVGTTGQPGR
jgi:hypothetical protein